MSYELDRRTSIFEDELPEDLTEDEYTNWYEESWVDGVRMGPAVRRNNEEDRANDFHSRHRAGNH